MKISLNWLKELVDFNLTTKELAEKLSLVSIGIKQQTLDFLELDLTYNRGDLLSLQGVAREVSAITGSKLLFSPPDEKDYPWTGKDLPETPVRVEEQNLCPVYCIATIENLKVEQSPESWVKRLSDCGMRTVNNIADVTNLIMLQYGQPMHAFDAAKVAKQTLIVRCAQKGEKLITLDGKRRDLNQSDLLIADPKNSLGLAGVMGGKDSEVSNSSTKVLLEAAIFDPVVIRKTSKRHGLNSEASKRFQHGLTKANLLQALSLAIKMYEGLGGKLTAISLVGNLKDEPKIITLTQEKINSLMGVNIPANQVELSLQSLGFSLASQGEAWEATVPYFRQDLNIEEDLIEEVARMYGYENIEGEKLIAEKIPDLDQSLPQFIYDLKVKLKGVGLTEVQTYSFYSTAVLEALEFTKEAKLSAVKIANPISSETEYLRMDLWPNLLEVVGKNLRKGFKDIAIFEIGKVYKQENGQPKETDRLSIALMNDSDNPLEELYQLAQSLSLHLKGVNLNPDSFHPKRKTNGMAEVHLRLLNKLGIEKRVAVMEFLL